MKPLLATKLKNQLLAINPELTVQLKNISINGDKQGCSGFVTDPTSDKIAYLNTEHNHHTGAPLLYREAAHLKDFTGGRNRHADYDELAEKVVALLAEH